MEKNMSNISVSIVLNMHREALCLRPTLLSLEACATEAAKKDVSVELIAVFDRADTDTLTVFNQTPLNAFKKIKTIEVNLGSLGPARNAGIEIAEGEYIWTADGDDIVSSNAIIQLLETAQSKNNSKLAVFIDFWVAFGEPWHVARYFGTDWLTAADFAYQHPFVSRIFIRRHAFRKFRYKDLRVTAGFAYEDWDLNCRLIADGYEFAIAPNTAIFYRQQPNSLLKQANSISSNLIPHNPAFKPEYFISAMDRAKKEGWMEFMLRRRILHQRNFVKELLQSSAMREHIVKATRLEPEIEPQHIENASSYFPVPWDDKHWGFQLQNLYQMIGMTEFTDVVLIPWLKPGGAEKYILQILTALKEQNSAERILVISGQEAIIHEWSAKLPTGSVFIDLHNSFPELDQQGRISMAVRAMLALTKPNARIHFKASEFSHEIMDRFGAALSSCMQLIYYRFSDDSFVWDGCRLSNAWGIRYLRKNLAHISHLISDCQHIAKADSSTLGISATKHHIIYAKCDLTDHDCLDAKKPQFRLLWSSRVCKSKRPDLLLSIAAELHNRLPNITIDVYGPFEAPNTPSLFDVDNISYKGVYSNFSDLPNHRYDGLIYTTAFDGLPNVILEALGAGLPVIAPAIAGIPEAVIDGTTGFLINDDIDDGALVDHYLKAIEKIYGDWSKWCEMSIKAKTLISKRHNHITHATSVAKAFGIAY